MRLVLFGFVFPPEFNFLRSVRRSFAGACLPLYPRPGRLVSLRVPSPQVSVGGGFDGPPAAAVAPASAAATGSEE